MNKRNISLKTIIAIIGAYAAYGIGSGFATGQEILQYFASWGPEGMAAALLGSALLMGISFSILVRDGFLHNEDFHKDSDCFAYYGGKYIGGFIDIFSIALVLGVYVEVFAGCGATINQYFGLPAFTGAIVMGIIVAAVVMLGLKRIVQILSCLGVVFIIYTVCFGIYCIAACGGTVAEAGSRLPEYIAEGKVLQISVLGIKNPFWAGLNYGGVNLIVAVAFVLALGRGTRSRAEAAAGGAGAGVVFMVPVLFSAITILLNIDYIAEHGQQVPSLAAVSNMLPSIGKIYLVILVLGIFTTLTGYTWLIVDRFAEEGTKKSRIICAAVVLFGMFAGSILTFNAVINVLFPIAGLVGMFLTLLMIIKEIRIRTGRKG